MSSLAINAIINVPPPMTAAHSPRVLAVWIDGVAPCVVGAQSQETYGIIRDYLIARGVKRDVITQAFSYSNNKWIGAPPARMDVSVNLSPPNSAPSVGVRTTDAKTAAEMLADHFEYAAANDDHPKMLQFLRAFKSLLENMNSAQREGLRTDPEVSTLWEYVRIGRNGSITIYENLEEFEAKTRGEGEAAP